MLETKKFSFGREFQVRTLALMRRKFEFLITSVAIIQPEYFEDKVLSWAFTTFVDHYNTYGTCAEKRHLDNELDKAVAAGRLKNDEGAEALSLISEIEETDVSDGDPYTVNEVVRFCRRQEVRRALIEVAPQTESEDSEVWEKIEERISKACNVGAHSLDIGTSYFGDMEQRLKNRLLDEGQLVIPTGIADLDAFLGGGLKSGQLGMWMGVSGSGKSVVLPHCGKRAVIGKWKVAHYTLELSEFDVATRYDAAWTGIPLYSLKQSTQQVQQRLGHLRTMYGEALIIKEYPAGVATVETLRQHIVAMRNTLGFRPDMLVVDYGDLLKPTTTYKDKYDDLGTIFTELRGLAQELKIPIWTATQANRTGNNQETIDIDQIADSFQKIMVADVVVSLAGTKQDQEEGIVRLTIAKNRNGPQKKIIPIKTAYERMCFFDQFAEPPGDRKRTPVPPNGAPNGRAPGMPRRPPRADA